MIDSSRSCRLQGSRLGVSAKGMADADEQPTDMPKQGTTVHPSPSGLAEPVLSRVRELFLAVLLGAYQRVRVVRHRDGLQWAV